MIFGTWDSTSATGGVVFISKPNTFFPTALTTTTASNTTLTTSGDYNASGVLKGDLISGTGIIDGAHVVSVDSATSLTMSENATDSTANSRTFTRPGRSPYSIITAKAISSVSSTTMTGARIKSGVAGQHLDITCPNNDAGYWSVYCY